MLVQEVLTDRSATEVVRLARDFFTSRLTPYGASVREHSDAHVAFALDSGELVIGTVSVDGRTLVRGSTSRAHHELSQFLTTLGSDSVRQNRTGPGSSGAG